MSHLKNWQDAMKIYREKNNHKIFFPKKGTQEYDEIKKIYDEIKNGKGVKLAGKTKGEGVKLAGKTKGKGLNEELNEVLELIENVKKEGNGISLAGVKSEQKPKRKYAKRKK
jgi:hypothetical protein